MHADRTHRAILGLAAAVAAVLAFSWARPQAQAVIAPSPCPGNVCTGTATVGGQAVSYEYTQHLRPNGEFRIRFNGGTYNTSGLVSFIVHDMPAFASTGYLVNPVGGQAMSEVDVNPGNTAYERRDSNGCTGCTYDHVMSVTYASLPAGTHSFSFTIVQNGDSGGLTSVPFYVDAAAPTNANESSAWGAITGMDFPCADAVDNDLDFRGDCADAQCTGSVGQVATGALCQIPENTCNDEFDNDADGLMDCLDADCDGLVGQPSGSAVCQYGNEYGAATCIDNFDNDADGRSDCVDNLFNAGAGGDANTICWKKPAFNCPAVENCATGVDDDKDKSYDDAWDDQALTGVNCTDYDCAGNPACPAREHQTAGGSDADAQCFNGVDDDLDHLTDCGDPDCRGIVNPGNTSQICYEKEFDLGQRYQFCGNTFDDDGDGPQDCGDSDCARRFGNCGPCPAREDFTYSACANGGDDDTDAALDCADADCTGKLGVLTNAGSCAAAENSNDLCADGFDNDRDGLTDCVDSQCNGRVGPLGAICQPSGESSCGNGLDNDGDGRIDCVDVNCAGVGSCAPNSWVQAASCQVVPRFSAATPFTGSSPTVTAVVRLATHVSTVDTVRFIGSATYSSVTMILGDNTDPTKYYPYAAVGPGCALTDTLTSLPAARFSFTAVAGHALQIFNTPGPDISGFDITLTCAVPAVPAAQADYPISISVLKEPGSQPEYGDANFSTTLYEATDPSVIEVEPEAAVGATVRVPYGGVASPASRRFRGVPSDPGVGLDATGICRCDVDLGGVIHAGAADCITAPQTFLTDQSLAVRARAEDGAGNVGAYSGVQNFTINVTPALLTPLSVLPSKPFFRTGDMVIDLTAEFLTGASDFFGGNCDVYVRDQSGVIVNGPVGPTLSFPGIAVGNSIRCQGAPTLPSMPDGTYYVTVRVTDNDGDSLETNRKAMFMCDAVPAAGDPEPTNGCQYADFDGDGAAEGLFTALYSASPKACDNCVGLSNSSQVDTNANGVGDICEPNDEYGRCEIDTDIVCSWDSDDPVHCPGDLCCPGPSIGLDYSQPGPPYFQKDPQACKFAWGLCTLDGQVCFEDSDCPGGQGLCQDGLTSCYRDVDCIPVAGTPACVGADRCENLLFPWLQTSYGNIFSKKKITAQDVPPQNQYNATFCITAKDTIFNFQTQGLGGCAAQTDASVRYEFPQSSTSFTSVLGKIDIPGLRSGKYGTVIDVASGQLDTTLSSYSNRLGGRVYRVVGDATLGAHVIANDTTNGAGTIFIDGGNLTINGDVTYDVTSVTALDHLATLGIIVVDDGTGTKGNVYVQRDVSIVSAALYAGGQDGFWSVAPPDADGPAPFTLYGMAIARQFHLSRSYKSLTQGSERFIYDGRAVVNPPPGFADLTRRLPVFADTPAAP